LMELSFLNGKSQIADFHLESLIVV